MNTDFLGIPKGRWLIPLLLAASLPCLWLAHELLSKDVALVIGWITLFLPGTLGVATAKLVGIASLAIAIGGFYLISIVVKTKYAITISPHRVSCHLSVGKYGFPDIPTSDVIDVFIKEQLDHNENAQQVLVIKSNNSEIIISKIMIDEPLETACSKIKNFISARELTVPTLTGNDT